MSAPRLVIILATFSLFLSDTIAFSQQNYGEFNRSMIIHGKEGSTKTGSYLHAIPDYDLSVRQMLELLKADSNNLTYLIDIAFTYFKSPYQKTLCIPYCKKAIKLGKPEEVGELYYPLGISYRMTGEFEKAIAALKKYTENIKNYDKFLPQDELLELISEVNREIQICRNAIELNENPPIKFYFDNIPYHYFINSAGKKVNSVYDDYNPIILHDTVMIFTSRRNSTSAENFHEDGRYYEDVYSTTYTDKNWAEAKKLNISTGIDESANSISKDKKKLYLIRNRNKPRIFASEYSEGKWQKPQKIKSEKNSKVWENCLGVAKYDTVVYFVQNTKGGYGGKDIYKSVKSSDGTWGMAINLGPTINTPYQEESPFLSPDGKYLYFASNGHKTMGGFDIFRSKFINNSWSTPENLLSPINSENNEMYFSITKEGKTAYLSSQRIRAGRNDMNLYQITFAPEFETAKYAMLEQDECSCPIDSGLHSRYFYDNSSGTISLKGVEVQYFFDNGKMIAGDKMDSKGRFPSREMSYNNPYAIHLKSPDSTLIDAKALCEHGKIIVRGPGGALYLMESDENCVFRVKTIKAQFIYSLLEKELIQGLKIQVLDETGGMICEETTGINGEFCYRNPENQLQLFKLVTDTPSFYKDAAIVVLGPDKKLYKFTPDENAIFWPEEYEGAKKVHFHSYRKLLPDTNLEEICGSIYRIDESSVPRLSDLSLQVLGLEDQSIAEIKTNDDGEFCYIQKTGNRATALKLMNADSMKLMNTEIILGREGKKIYKLLPDETRIFRPEELLKKEEKIRYHSYRLLLPDTNLEEICGSIYHTDESSVPLLNELSFQVLGLDDQSIIEVKTGNDGHFCFVQKAGNSVTALKLIHPDSIRLMNTEIVLESAKKKITTFKPDENNYFKPASEQEEFAGKNLPFLVQDTNYVNIFGNLYYNNDITKPVKNMTVTLKNEKHEIFQRSVTDSSGAFIFEKVPEHQLYSIMMDEFSPSFNSNTIYLIPGNVEFFGQKLPVDKFKLFLDGKYDENLITMITDNKGQFKANYLPGIYYTQVAQDATAITENLITQTENTPASIINDTLFTIRFGYDKSLLDKQYADLLDALCTKCLKDTSARFQLTGHADSKGNDDYNQQLSKRRAESIANYMVSKGIKRSRIKVIGAGEKHPIAPNHFPDGTDNPEGRQLNRRVEVSAKWGG